MAKSTFQGFSIQTFKFLRDLKRHNDREWFAQHRDLYEEVFLAPALAYIEAMQQPLQKVSPLFSAVPKKVGGSLMRIFRDVRFAGDKSPYKTNIGIHFRHDAGKDVHAPGFYVHIEPGECFLGVGMWHPDAPSLAAVREAITAHPTAWKKARDHQAFRNQFTLAGDLLQRPPRGVDHDHPFIEDLKRKDFIGIQNLADPAVSSPDFVKESIEAFQSARPFTRFLCEAVGVGF